MFVKAMNLLLRVNSKFEKFEYLLCQVTMGLTVLIISLQVLMRYAFNRPLTWPEELSTLLLVWMTFAGSSILLKHARHIDIDFFVNLFPKRLQNYLALLNYILMFLFCFVAAYGAYKLQFLQFHHYTVALRIPKSFFTLPIVIAGVSMCLHLVFAVVKKIAEMTNKEGEA